ncbi:MAG: cytochrome P460 family protein [Bdellovibrionales bacterium]|nr:cytochrome P460 family protein [Bdellovibrionales bacterium]
MKYLFLILLPFLAEAQGGEDVMNDISFSKYKNFERDWKMVTVRYRRDTGEMRFTYANPTAYKALLEGKSEYPDGAVFAKIGAGTSPDADFASSEVPSGTRRFQLMVRNSKKYASTGGWGYALFDHTGKTFDEDVNVKTQSCYACHLVVQNKGYVFSEPFISGLDPKVKWSRKSTVAPVTFEVIERSQLPSAIFSHWPEKFKQGSSLQGSLRDVLFQGTLDEIRPTLANEAFRSQRPAILISRDSKRFSVVIPQGKNCQTEGKTGQTMIAFITTKPSGQVSPGSHHFEFCHSH